MSLWYTGAYRVFIVKSIVAKKTRADLPMRYRPYKSRLNQKLLRLFLR